MIPPLNIETNKTFEFCSIYVKVMILSSWRLYLSSNLANEVCVYMCVCMRERERITKALLAHFGNIYNHK